MNTLGLALAMAGALIIYWAVGFKITAPANSGASGSSGLAPGAATGNGGGGGGGGSW